MNRANRIEYIDRLRGLAVIGMVFAHSLGPWCLPEVKAEGYGLMVTRVSGWIAPIFMTLAGFGVALIVLRAAEKQEDLRAVHRRLASRGLEIVVSGFALEFTYWALAFFSGPWERIFKVNILQCIGLSMVLAVAYVRPTRGFNGRALVAFLLFVLGAQVTWRVHPLAFAPAFIDGLTIQLPEIARFPLFPYAGWVAFGVLLGGVWPVAGAPREAEVAFFLKLMVAGLALYASSEGLEWLTYHFGLHRIGVGPGELPPGTTVHGFLYKAALVVLFLILARLIEPLLSSVVPRFNPLLVLGKTSLFGYWVHLLIIHISKRMGLAGCLSASEHLLAVAVLSVVLLALCYWWKSDPVGRAKQRLKQRREAVCT